MDREYKAAFIVPVGAEKIMGEYGWEIQSNHCLPLTAECFLTGELDLKLLESYLEYTDYSNQRFKASIAFNDQKQIEHIYIQVFGNNLELLKTKFNTSPLNKSSELFIPSEIDKLILIK